METGWFKDSVPQYVPNYVLGEPAPKLKFARLEDIEFLDEEITNEQSKPAKDLPSEQ